MTKMTTRLTMMLEEKKAEKDRSVTTADGTKIDVTDGDDDSDNPDALEAALTRTCNVRTHSIHPLGDDELDVAREFFGDIPRDSLITSKVKKVIDRIRKNFETNEWRKGMEVKSSTSLTITVSRISSPRRRTIGHTTIKSDKAPDEDVEKLEGANTRQGNRIPTDSLVLLMQYIVHLQIRRSKQLSSGEVEGNKWENLEAFKNDPKINILIANEMGISEGHNP